MRMSDWMSDVCSSDLAGVYGAELARRGFTGIDGVFEAEYGGFCSTLSDTPNPAVLTDGPGERFETENVGFKIYSCCGSCQARKSVVEGKSVSVRVILGGRSYIKKKQHTFQKTN